MIRMFCVHAHACKGVLCDSQRTTLGVGPCPMFPVVVCTPGLLALRLWRLPSCLTIGVLAHTPRPCLILQGDLNLPSGMSFFSWARNTYFFLFTQSPKHWAVGRWAALGDSGSCGH